MPEMREPAGSLESIHEPGTVAARERRDHMMPLRFVFGLHLHQPVGNFDHVFRQHLDDVYDPLIRQLEAGGLAPSVLHVSGPLLEWLETHATGLVDRLGRLAADGRVELLLAGMYEPILASLPRRDRVEQIIWMREALQRKFGVTAQGLWLTERVWEPELAADLADAGVRYALVDDRHFLVSGFDRQDLHTWYNTESDGRRVALFPIDERLRYLIPFRPPAETADYLRSLRDSGQQVALLGDDGEKFGGWPGTKAWVYERGWFAQFVSMLEGLRQEGVIELSTLGAAFDAVPGGGLAYLPTASYREMEGWALPAEPYRRLERLTAELGDRMEGPEGALLRGSHWRHFLVKYAESNRLHKHMCALSALCRLKGNSPDVRRAIARAQCNDAYWHGVFGGLYLPFLRRALWAELAYAERAMRKGQELQWEVHDHDADGYQEVWIHSEAASVVIAPSRGGSVEIWQHFGAGYNLADALTRRREAYHLEAVERDANNHAATDGSPSIHDLEHQLQLSELPPVDHDVRAVFVERLLPTETTAESFAAGTVTPLRSWARTHFGSAVARAGGGVEVQCQAEDGSLQKHLRVEADGTLVADFDWRGAQAPHGSWFSTELSLAEDVGVEADGSAIVERYVIETVAKSERGFDRTAQGIAILVRWRAELGRGSVRVSRLP